MAEQRLIADTSHHNRHNSDLHPNPDPNPNPNPNTLLTGIQKAWIWQHFAMAKFSWDFLISDVAPSFVDATLQPIQTRFLKKWVGLAVKADPSILYRSHGNAGLG